MSSQLLKSKNMYLFLQPIIAKIPQTPRLLLLLLLLFWENRLPRFFIFFNFYKRKRGTQRTGIKVFGFFFSPLPRKGGERMKSRFIAKKYVQKKEPRLPRDEKEGGTSSSQKEREIYIYLPRKKKDGLQSNPPPPCSSSYSSPSIPLLTFKFFTYIHNTTNRNASTKGGGVGVVGGWVMGGAKENTPIAPAWWPSELGPKKNKKGDLQKNNLKKK